MGDILFAVSRGLKRSDSSDSSVYLYFLKAGSIHKFHCLNSTAIQKDISHILCERILTVALKTTTVFVCLNEKDLSYIFSVGVV